MAIAAVGVRVRCRISNIRWKRVRACLATASAGALAAVALLVSPGALAQGAVCAQVKIEIKQKLSLERQAFDAHMQITNGLDASAITNVGVNLIFKDSDGNNVVATSDPTNTTASFFVRVDSLAGVGAIDGSGSVGPKTTGDIHWIIIPAAGTGGVQPQGKMYFIGATLSYSLAGQPSSVTVTPDFVTVKPQPLLALDYFLAGDVYSDDPFTPEVEPPVPFTLGVRIKNVGGGTAAKTSIESAQPRIIDNQQGLLVAFQILSSYVNDQPAAKTLLINFGDIGPGISKVGRWNMVTTLSGKFIDLQAGYTHADSLGGALTSLIQGINTHLLVHDVRVDLPGRDAIRDFLALDGDVLRVYESEGTDSVVTDQSAGAQLQTITPTQYRLTFAPTVGLAYAKLTDPFSGQKPLDQVVRSDGKVVPAENIWLSKKRNADLTWSYYLNIFDANTTGSYTVNFTAGGAASLSGFVYIDANNNGAKDATENGIGAVAVTLGGTDDQGAGVSTTGYTIPGGSFTFSQLQPGTYSVKVAPVSGYVDGTLAVGSVGGNAAGDTMTGITLAAGVNATGYLFAKRTSTTPPATRADLAITMSASAVTVAAGANVTFTLAASNAGPDLATSVKANDLLPAGLTFVGATASPGSYDSASGQWSIGDLASGQGGTLTLIAKVVSATTPLTNTATIASLVPDLNLANNTASVTLNADAGSLKVAQAVLKAARVLVLASCSDGAGNDDAACAGAHSSFATSYLGGLGLTARVVTDTETFRSAFRSGVFNTYWISGGAAKLSGTLAQEVREAAFRGDTVLVDGVRDPANVVLDEATGVSASGPKLGTALPIALGQSTVATLGDASSFALRAGAQSLASFPTAGNAPAIVINHYGQGQGVVAAFDLIATLQQTASEQAMHSFISQLFATLAPTPPDPVVGAAYVPLTTTIENTSTATVVDVTATLPAGVSAADISPAPTSATAAQVNWHFDLPAGQTTTLSLGLRVPSTSGTSTLQTVVMKGEGGNATLVGTYPRAIAVAASDQFGPQLISGLAALSIADNADRAARDAAVAALQAVAGAFVAGQFELAIGKLVTAGNALATVATVNVVASELVADDWLQEAELRWYLAPPAPTSQVAGTVTRSGNPLAGVSFTATNGGTCATSDAAGHYACTVPSAWSGSITPALSGNTFTPSSRSYSNVQSDQSAQDYVASLGGQPPAFTSGAPPSAIVGTAFSFTVTASGAPAPSFSVSSGSLPPGLTLAGASGLISGTPTAAGAFSGVITASNAIPPDAQQNFLINVALSAQTITFAALSDRALGTPPFALSATASSGLPVAFAAVTPTVCPVNAGTVTLEALGTCIIRASQAGDANFAAAPDVLRSFAVVAASVAPLITSAAPVNGSVGTAYSHAVTASGYPAPVFSVSSGSLPPGPSLDGVSGLISGTPTSVGTYIGVLMASNGVSPNATQSFAIVISATAPPPSIVNGSFETPVMPGGADGYQYFNGSVAGWNFVGAGIQRYGSAWGASDSGDGQQTAFIQNLGSLAQTINLPAGAYAVSFLAARRSYGNPSGGVQPIQVSVDGVAAGAPIAPPDTSFRVFTVPFTVNAGGAHTLSFAGSADTPDQSTFIDAVTLASTSRAPAITSAAPSNGNIGTAYAFAVTATGYPAPTFAVAAGALPPGLSLNATTGLISGSPTAAGTFSGTISAANGVPPSATQSFAISISATPPPPAIVNGSFETPVMASGPNGYQYFTGTTAGWQFAGSGIQRYGSAWGASDSGDGQQTAFIQNMGSLAQTINLPAGAYAVSFLAARRSYGNPLGGVQPIQLSVDGIALGAPIAPPDTSFSVFTVPFTVSAGGAHTLSFAGTADTGDQTTFIDAVSLASASGAPTITSAAPSNGSVGTAYSFAITAMGYPAPTFSVTNGALPPGLSLDGITGLISGAPTTAGTFGGTVSATNGISPNATQSFAIVISATAPPPSIVNGSFETPVMPGGADGYQYFNGSVAGWNFVGAGIQRYGSAWGASDSGDGQQTAFIQNLGSLAQTINLPAGAYAVSFLAARRSYGNPSGGVQPIQVSVDGVAAGAPIAPPDTSFRVFTVPFTVNAGGAHTLSFAGSADSPDQSTFIDAVTLASANEPATANFVRSDVATQGNWKGVYGGDGYAVFEDSKAYPAFARITPADKLDYVWDAQPGSSRALQRASAGRIAACWYSGGGAGGSFSIDVNLLDLAMHSVAVSMLDWDALGRSTSIAVIDVLSGQTIDARTVTGYSQGVYLVWNVKGHVRFQFTNSGGPNAVVSGIFLGAPLP